MQEILRVDRHGKLVGMLRVDVLRQRLDEEVRVEVQEERQRVARVAGALARRIGDAVRGGAQVPVGQPLQHVAHVAHQRCPAAD